MSAVTAGGIAQRVEILLIEDEKKTAAFLEKGLQEAGYTVAVAGDGEKGAELARAGDFDLLIIDVMLPKKDGWTIVQELRAANIRTPILFLTARDSVPDRVKGLELGADDYLVKPFDPSELRARVHTGARVISLQNRLIDQIAALQTALASVKQLRGLLPMCSYCKRIRKDTDYWEQLETYIAEHSEAEFSHGICPTCLVEAEKEFDR